MLKIGRRVKHETAPPFPVTLCSTIKQLFTWDHDPQGRHQISLRAVAISLFLFPISGFSATGHWYLPPGPPQRTEASHKSHGISFAYRSQQLFSSPVGNEQTVHQGRTSSEWLTELQCGKHGHLLRLSETEQTPRNQHLSKRSCLLNI